MMKERGSNYAYKVKQAKDFSFYTMMRFARNFVNSLDEDQSNELFEKLNRGVDLLSSGPLMNMYLYAFGNMHEAKLKLAFENMGEDYKQMNDFAIIDYGCGQGLASVVLFDHLKEQGLDKYVHKVVLIEPSETALKRAALHVFKVFPDAEIVTINEYLDDVYEDDISCDNQMTFHLFSNILDVESVSIDHLAELVNGVESLNKIFVCVSPNFGGAQRNNRIDEFCWQLDGEYVFECDKTKGEWINGWSCKIKVYQKMEYVEPLSTEVTKEELAEAREDESGVKYSKDGKKLLKVIDEDDLFDDISEYEEISEYYIEEGTEVICVDAFKWCEHFRSVIIPNSVTSIGDGVFSKCNILVKNNSSNFFSDGHCLIDLKSNRLLSCHRNDLENYIIPNSVASIGKNAFAYCHSLQNIIIPNSVASFGEDAFMYCDTLQNIIIPNSVVSIGRAAFSYCTSLQNIIIPNSVTSIGENAFYFCFSLQNINISNSVINIGNYAFRECTSLQSITLPNSIKNIGDGIFEGCDSLRQIYIPNKTKAKFEKLIPEYKSLLIEL